MKTGSKTSARTRRTKALQLGTALATTLFVGGLATPAFGQALPDLGTTGTAVGVTITPSPTPTPTRLDIDLNDGSRVINWESFNVGTGNTVNYLTTNLSNQYAVLNRVTVLGNASTINGAVTTATNSNIVVWLSNPNGILVGPSGSFNTGGLVLTTLDTDPIAFLATGGGTSGFALTGGSKSITIGGTLSTTATSGLIGTLLLAAPQITVTGSATATGTAALVAASDANFSAGIGSPLSVTITAGSPVTGIDISDGVGTKTPTISGDSVALVGASATAVMSALLNVDAGASLTATGTNGSILLATKPTGAVALTANADVIAVQGSLTTQTGGNVSIQAAGAATVGSAVSAGTGGYSVSGSDVTLGSAAGARTQSSTGAVTIASGSASPIQLAGDLTLSGSSGSLTPGVKGNGFDLTLGFGSTTTLDGAKYTGIKNLATNGGGTTSLRGDISTTGTQTYGEAVTLAANTKLASTGIAAAGSITLGGTVDGAFALAVNTAGTTRFGGAVGGGMATALVSLTTDAGGGTTLGGGAVTTTGAQTYGDLVTLDTNTVLTGDSGSFNGLSGTGFDLTLNLDGTTTLDGSFATIKNLTTGGGGTTSLSGTITTTGAQIYGEAVTLAGDVTVAGTAVTFGSTVDGTQSLTVNSGGATTFGGAVGTGMGTALTSLTTDATGTTLITGGAVKTSGAQSYGDDVTLGNATTLTGTTGSFAAIFGGTFDLTLAFSGATTILGNVTGVANLIVSGGSTTQFGGGTVTTSGSQTFNDQILLGANTVFTGTAGTFAAGLVGNGKRLTLSYSAPSSLTGAFTGIDDLVVDGGGTTALSGSISTVGGQTYSDAITLAGATTLGSSSAGDIAFGSTLNGGQALTVNTGGTTRFGGAVGATTALASLTTDAGGGTAINGESIKTNGAQTYGDLVTLGADTVLTGGSGSFLGVNGATFDLTLALGGTIALNGTFTDIDDLVSNGGGTTTLSGAILTTGTQTYTDAVVLAGTTMLTAGTGKTVSFASTIDSTDQTQALTVTTDGLTTFGGLIGSATGSALLSLTTNGGGTTAVDGGGITTVNGQTYADAVTLGTNGLFSGGGNIAFQGTLDGPGLATIDSRGSVSFGGAVGATTALARITVTGDTGIAIDGGAISTVGDQAYNNAVTLGTSTLTASSMSGDIGFASTIDGAVSLGINTSGTTTLGGAVGATTALASLSTDLGGSTAINGGSVRTSNAQTYNDAVTLGAATTLSSITGANITLGSTVDGLQALTVNTIGTTTLKGRVGATTALASLTTNAVGTTAINGGSVSTTNVQSYGEAVTLGANTTLTGGGGSFAAGLTGNGFDLTLDLGGTTTLDSGFTGIRNLATGNGGTTTLTGTISTTGTQTYNDIVNLLGATTLVSSGMGAAGNVTFANTLDGMQALAVNTAGTTAFNAAVGGTLALAALTTNTGGTTAIGGGVVRTTGAQTYNDAVTLVAGTTLTSTGGGNLTFSSTLDGGQALALNSSGIVSFTGAVGATDALASLTTNVLGATAIDGGSVRTTGTQTYNDAVTLGAATTLSSTTSGAITLGSTVDGGQALTVNTAGVTTLRGAVGAGTALASLTTDADGTTDLNGGAVKTTGTQSYNDLVVLSADTVLDAGGAVGFAQTIDSDATARALTVNTTAATTFGGAVGSGAALASLTTNAGGTTAINGGAVMTSGAQSFGDAVTLGTATTLTSTGGAGVTLGSTVDGSQALTINTTGATIFTGAVGATMALTSLTTNAGGTTAIDGGAVNTTGAQSYNDAATLGTTTVLASSGTGNIAFATTLDGARALTVNTGGITTFGGVVGGFTALTSLTTNAGGSTALNGGAVNTTGAQSYDDAVTLGTTTVLSSTGTGNIAFATTLNGAQVLTVNTAGISSFGGVVGGLTALSSLTTNVGGSTTINGGAVNTTGSQTYNDAVTLGAATTLASTSAGNIAFATTLNGAQALSINTAGITSFGGVVGGLTALSSLTTNVGGSTTINGGAVNTTGAQMYNDAVTLGAATTLASTASGNIGFATTLNGAQGLTVNTAGIASFGGVVGGITALASLTTDGAGDTALNGGTINTTGAQTYNDAVTLGVATTLNSTASGALTFASTLDGPFALTANTQGATVFLGAVGGTDRLASLTTDAGGETDLNGGTISTSGAQAYNDTVVLSADTTLVAGGSVGFATTVDSQTATARSLTVNTAAATTFGGAIGATNRLDALTTDTPGTTALNGGSVRTTGAQTFNDAVTLGANTTLTSTAGGALTFNAAVDGARTLTLSTSGPASLVGVAGGTTPLTGLTVTAGNVLIADATIAGLGAATVTATGNVRIGTLRAGPISLTADGDVTGLAGVSTASDTAFGRANLLAAAPITINGDGLVQLGTVNAPGPITIAAGNRAGSGNDGSIDIANANATGALNLTAYAATPVANAAHDGDIVVGTANVVSGTATLTNAAGNTGDIVITGKLTASGNISLASADDVLIGAYNPAADAGLIRSAAGDIAIDAQGSVFGIGGGENTLPTTQRGVAALSTTGNLTINSDGDARFDSLTAGGSLTLNIAGSLTGSPLSGGVATGTAVPGGALFATGAGGDVTIRSGLAGTALLDVVTLDRIVADRNITINADQLAVGMLATNTGTITLNDTSGAALTADNYYVGLLSGTGDLTVVFTGQPTAAIPLVALDAAGAPETFDAAFGKTDLIAATAISGTIGSAAQLSDIGFGSALNLGTGALVADTLTSINGNATIMARTGTLSVLMTTLGGALALTKSGGSAATAGDELRLRSASTGGSALLTSSTHIRIGTLGSGGTATLSAARDLTGLAGTSTGTSSTAFGRADLSATGAIGEIAGGLAQLGTVTAGTSLALSAGTASSDGSIDLTTAQAGTSIALTATAIAPLGDAAHDGDILIGTATARTTLLVSNVSGGGDSGNIVSGALIAGGDTRIDAANDLTLATVGSGGSLGARARRDVFTTALTAAEDIGVSAGRAATLGALAAGDDVVVTGAGSVSLTSVTARGLGPDTRTVAFASPTALAFPAETNAGGDVVVNSTGANVIVSGAISAASDVMVTASTSAALLGSTTATAGNVGVISGASAQLVGDVSAGSNTTVTAGTTAAIQQNVTAVGNYTVTGGTGITLGDALARTQQAGGAITVTATTGDVAQGTGRLTVVSNSDVTGTETLTIAGNAGNILLANSQLTGGSLTGRESDVVLSASGAISADDLDGDRVGLTAGGNIVADTIEAGTGAADLGDLAQRQSVDLVSTGGSITVNTAQAFGTGHDIDIRAATGLTATTLSAGGSLVGRAGNAIAIGTASAGEDVALKSNTATIAITGTTIAGDDILLTAPGAISTGGAVTASGTGPDTRTVAFGAGALDAAYTAETFAGADVVAISTGASFNASGALSAASDVTITTATSVAVLGATTATAGNLGFTSGTSAQLVGDVTSGGNITITAGTTAIIQQNVTAAANYTVVGGTGVTLGEASARSQQANGAIAITATSGDVIKGSGRLTVIANADRTAANNGEPLTISATNGNIVLANSQLTGGSTAGRESDIRLTAKGSIVAGKVDGASLTARATTGFATGEAVVAGNAARGADPISNASTVDIEVTAGPLSFTDITATNTGHDVVLNASGAINGANISAARSVLVNGGSLGVTGATTATAASVTINGGSSATLGSLAAGTNAAVGAGAITVGPVVTGTTLNLNATGSTLAVGSATSGGDVTLAAATRATLGPVTAIGRNVTLSATDADLNGAIAATQITVIDRATGANPLRLGDGASGSGGFALGQTEVNRLNAPTVILDAGTSVGSRQDVAIGALALDADTGATRLDLLGLQRFDVTGTISATGSGTRTLRLGGSATATARATTMRFATTAADGGRVLVPGVALDLRSDRIGMGLDANFLATLGLTPGGSPATPATVASDYVARGSSTLYVADTFGAAIYTTPTILSASSLTVRYSDYALFQNTGGSAVNSGSLLASSGTPTSPALFLQGPNPPNAGGFALFGTINGVPDSAAAVLGDSVLTLIGIDRLSARVNGCLIGSGSGCIASTTSQPPLPPLNAFRGDIFSTQGNFSIPFDPVVGTNNESLFGDIGSFGLSDLPLQPIECDPGREGDCAAPAQDDKPEDKAP